MNTLSNLNPYMSCLGKSLPSFETIEKGVEIISNFLDQEILCSHDIKNLTQAYNNLDKIELKSEFIPQENSATILCTIIDKMKTIHQKASSAKQIITAHHLKKFEISLINEVFTPHFELPELTIEKIKDIAAYLPYCCEEEDFAAEVEILLGQNLTDDIKLVIQDKKNHIHKRKEIKKRVDILEQLRKKEAPLYPPYLEELLEGGFFYLYDHLINMKQFPHRGKREAEEKTLPISIFSHIILEFQKATLARTEKFAPQGNNTLFLLGDTGSGKSTTLCYLRNDPLVLENDGYQLLQPEESIIGNHLKNSCTLFPNIDIVSGLTIIDFPGLHDSHGTVISLAIELSLRALLKKYLPKILILSPITNTEGKYVNITTLKKKLDGILGTVEHSTLGLTKYSRDSDSININYLEINKSREQAKLKDPSNEESRLEGSLKVLELYVEKMPELQIEVDLVKEQLSQLTQNRASSSPNLTRTEDELKQRHNNLIKNEDNLKKELGMTKVIYLKNLEDQSQLNHHLDALKCSQNILSLPKYHRLDPDDKAFLETLFKEKIVELISSQEIHNFSSSIFTASQEIASENEFLDPIKRFEENILKTSLINTLLLNSYPEIGQFFHLEEMDPTIIRDYDHSVIKLCIDNYVDKVLSDIAIINKLIDKCNANFSQNKVINQKLSSLQKYILTSYHGISDKADETKVTEAWGVLQKEHEDRIKARKKDLELSKPLSIAFIAILGIPYGIFALSKKNKLNKTHKESAETIIKTLTDCTDNIGIAIQFFKRIQKTVEDKGCIEDLHIDTSNLLESASSLKI